MGDMSRLGDFCCWDALSPDDITYLQRADAVIETARAHIADVKDGSVPIEDYNHRLEKLERAVEALDSKEE